MLRGKIVASKEGGYVEGSEILASEEVSGGGGDIEMELK